MIADDVGNTVWRVTSVGKESSRQNLHLICLLADERQDHFSFRSSQFPDELGKGEPFIEQEAERRTIAAHGLR